jgi:hypothetical protein
VNDFHGDQAKKKFFFEKKKIPKWPFFKMAIFQNRQFSKYFVKISWIGPWIIRID